MDLYAVATKRAIPGIMVLNHRNQLEFINHSALEFIAMVNEGTSSPRRKRAPRLVSPTVIAELYDHIVKTTRSPSPSSDHGDHRGPCKIVLVPTQEAIFCCRGFFIDAHQDPLKKTFHIMILIERMSPDRHGVDLEKLRPQFGLTTRQLEIMKPLLSGASNKEIANTLCVSVDAVKGHLRHIMRQMGVSSRTELLSMIFQH